MWNEDSYNNEDEALAVVEKFTNSKLYASICKDAEDGCTDSLEVLEHLSQHIASLCFHLESGSTNNRIQYELDYLKSFIALWFQYGDE